MPYSRKELAYLSAYEDFRTIMAETLEVGLEAIPSDPEAPLRQIAIPSKDEIDLLDIVGAVMMAEAHYDLTVPDQDLEFLKTDDVADLTMDAVFSLIVQSQVEAA